MAAIALQKRALPPQIHSNFLDLMTTAFPKDQVDALSEAVDPVALINVIIKDGAKAFTIAYSLFQLLSSGTATIAQVEQWALTNYRDVYGIVSDVCALFQIPLPPLPISPGPAKP